MNEIYLVKGKTRVLTARGYLAQWDVLGYVSGDKDEILEFYRKNNNRYSEFDLEEIEIREIRGSSKIEKIVLGEAA